MTSERFDRGQKIRREVLGDQFVDRAVANTDDFNREFQALVAEYCWGEVWSRDVLSRKQKSLNNLCMLAALNRATEFKAHVRGAINNGCTLDEIKETLLQVAIYCGIPAGVEAFRLARSVIDEMKPDNAG